MKVKLLKNARTTALAGDGYEISYAELYARSKTLEKKLGSPQKIVALFAENSPHWVATLYAAWGKGAAVAPIDAKSSVDELCAVLNDASPDTLCCDTQNLETAREAVAKAKKSAEILVIDDVPANDFAPDADENADFEISREEEDLALLVYTSGTTGNPKGVMLTFANMAANMEAVYEAKYYFDGIRVLAMLPFHHILPLMGTLIMPLSIGGKLVFPKSLSPADIGGILQKYPVDMIISVPRFYELLHANIMAKINASKIFKTLFNAAKIVNNGTFSRKLFGAIHKKFGGEIKFWISGGAALDKKVWRDLFILGFSIREGYGMSECAPIITFPRIGHIKMGSPGQALPGVEIRIADGEIAVRGKNVTKGYFNRPEETALAIRNGWLYTGDLGYLDEDGFLFITGRRKEILVLANGKNVNPAEIESQLAAFSADILETGVLMFDNMLQAVIRVSKKFITEHGGIDGAREAIRNGAILPYNRNVASYRRIIRFALTTDELPRTRVGKLKRYQLTAYIERPKIDTSAPTSEPSDEIYLTLKKVLSSQISVPVDCDAHMEMDLGLDSLGKVSMQCFVRETYGVEVSERDFEKYTSLRKFAEYVAKNRLENFEGKLADISWGNIINSKPYPEVKKPHLLHFALVWLFETLAKLLYKTHTSGLENLDIDGAAIIAPNHQSYVDALFVTGQIPVGKMYNIFFFAKLRNIIRAGFLRNLAERSNIIIMDINDNVRESIREIAAVLRNGGKVVIFPEGTRTKDGAVAEFRQTFAILAKEMNVPVVPVAISGAYEAIKPNATLPNFGAKIDVKFLPPMKADANESYKDFAERVQAEIASNIISRK